LTESVSNPALVAGQFDAVVVVVVVVAAVVAIGDLEEQPSTCLVGE